MSRRDSLCMSVGGRGECDIVKVRFSDGSVFCCNLAERLPVQHEVLIGLSGLASADENCMSCQSAMK